MSNYDRIIVMAAIRARARAKPIIDQMSDDEHKRCEKVVSIITDEIISGIQLMANTPRYQAAAQNRRTSFDQVMNVITFGLWD